MTWRINGPERNLPPEDFNERLRYLGGVTKYDENCFKVGWAQTETFTAGGVWSVDERYYKGYRQLLAGSGEPCWTLFQYHTSEEYGSPEAFYVANYDETTGLQILGEYPYSGKYECLYNLRWHTQENGKLTFHTMPLSTTTFDAIIPIILAAKDVSLEKKKAALQAAREAEEYEKVQEVERHLRDKAIPFSGGVSFTRQGIRSTVVDQKMRTMQQKWSQLQESAKQFSRPGLQTR